VYCRVIACDFDGTGAADGHLAPEVADVLHRARAQGVATLLVTGRVLEDLQVALVDFSAFDAVVAENGALVWLPNQERTIQLGASPPDAFLGRLVAAGIPFKAGLVVIGTWEGHAAQALALTRELGLDLQIVFNRAAAMLLPSGVNKAVGVRRALEELKRSERNMLAFGDAENDLPLFAAADFAVAPRGAVPSVAAAADDQLARPGASGVAHYVERVLAADCRLPSSRRFSPVLGRDDDGTPVTLPSDVGNVLVSGDPRSGKSWLAGLLAERLVEKEYQLCIFDPEGDHHSLAERPGVALLGQRLPLPDAKDLPAVLADLHRSVVLSLTRLDDAQKCAYVCTAFAGLAPERVRTGLPHWIFVDEAHYFLREGDSCCAQILNGAGNLALATYRPSLLAPSVHDSIRAHIVTRTEVDSERYFIESLLGTRAPAGGRPADMLAEIGEHQAGLLVEGVDGAEWRTFEPTPRVSAHVHHARKYVEGFVPEGKGFFFRLPGGGVCGVARNASEFAQALRELPAASLRHHLQAGDFSRWTRDVLGDRALAAGLAKIEYTTRLGAVPSRTEIIEHVRDRYVIDARTRLGASP
jgi:hydroxymethylpyrimidine pyrophosphatase-like HAD family hydrolase